MTLLRFHPVRRRVGFLWLGWSLRDLWQPMASETALVGWYLTRRKARKIAALRNEALPPQHLTAHNTPAGYVVGYDWADPPKHT